MSWNTTKEKTGEKINGANLVAPPKPMDKEALIPLKSIHADWISVIPYAFINPNEPTVRFDFSDQWWGESIKGSSKMIEMAKEQGFNVMLKPHVWVRGQGWAGDFQPQNEQDWKNWQKSYERYILTFAKIAESHDVPLLCVGTEFRKTTVQHPEYWQQLIRKVKNIYQGKITYAANWDNYKNITFWDDLDYIGIDAYFPLSEKKTPTVYELTSSWERIAHELQEYSARHSKPILFTEYGYESIDYTADGHWKHDKDTLSVNYTAQMNAYEGLYNAIWDETWFKGGFFWKWHLTTPYRPERLTRTFTPQNKPTMDVIKKWYAKND
ncbi:hypothetical protein FNH22_07485 [Fulvivirga sp. M361]|uniref:glycoside hydrolase family 113 n=1 Tax=Fulvivirga sp. M361 TaxID=2594266 RepID=UPI00117AD4F3|nr:hypothetical protein [Fulvivirga sp. M361]TRX60877.1 hypothetical protein FNH22_07485 [Fulvivirga sp. M361]